MCGTTRGMHGTILLLEGTSPRAERGSRAVGLSQEHCQRCYKPVERPLTASNLLLLSKMGGDCSSEGHQSRVSLSPAPQHPFGSREGNAAGKGVLSRAGRRNTAVDGRR